MAQRKENETENPRPEGRAGVGRIPKPDSSETSESGERYRTPDEDIKQEVERQLRQDDTVDTSEVEVSVTDGHVILTGVVDSAHTIDLAGRLANCVNDVMDVENQLEVRPVPSRGVGRS